MPALDRHHDAVADALRKDGWTITHNPLTLTIGERNLLVDLGAERLIGAEKGVRKIAVEIKTFGGPSPIADLEKAVGQFLLYKDVLAEIEPERELYLAVPEEAFQTIFTEQIGQLMLNRRLQRLLRFSPVRSEVVQWMP